MNKKHPNKSKMGNIKIIFIAVILQITSCNFIDNHRNMNNKNNNTDLFYSELYKNNHTRIPLIKPYELISSDEGFTWSLISPFNKDRDKKFIIGNIQKVAIHDSLIIVYSDMTSLPNQMSEAWGCIDITNCEESVFTFHKEFENFLKTKNISAIEYTTIKTLFEDYKKGKILYNSNKKI